MITTSVAAAASTYRAVIHSIVLNKKGTADHTTLAMRYYPWTHSTRLLFSARILSKSLSGTQSPRACRLLHSWSLSREALALLGEDGSWPLHSFSSRQRGESLALPASDGSLFCGDSGPQELLVELPIVPQASEMWVVSAQAAWGCCPAGCVCCLCKFAKPTRIHQRKRVFRVSNTYTMRVCLKNETGVPGHANPKHFFASHVLLRAAAAAAAAAVLLLCCFAVSLSLSYAYWQLFCEGRLWFKFKKHGKPLARSDIRAGCCVDVSAPPQLAQRYIIAYGQRKRD